MSVNGIICLFLSWKQLSSWTERKTATTRWPAMYKAWNTTGLFRNIQIISPQTEDEQLICLFVCFGSLFTSLQRLHGSIKVQFAWFSSRRPLTSEPLPVWWCYSLLDVTIKTDDDEDDDDEYCAAWWKGQTASSFSGIKTRFFKSPTVRDDGSRHPPGENSVHLVPETLRNLVSVWTSWVQICTKPLRCDDDLQSLVLVGERAGKGQKGAGLMHFAFLILSLKFRILSSSSPGPSKQKQK